MNRNGTKDRVGAYARVLVYGIAWAAAVNAALPLYAVITANVNIDAANVRATMSPMGIGMHTSPYYNDMSNSGLPGRLNEAGVTTLRFGGGGYADVVHWSLMRNQWENGITGGGLSPAWGQASNFGWVGSGSDFGSFVRLLDQVQGGKAVVTVNYGSAMKLVNGQSAVPDYGGQPKEAAAWVAYANADPSIFGTSNDITIGVDQQGNNWKTAGYWAKLRASTSAAAYQSWAQPAGLYDPLNGFLAINRPTPIGIKYWEVGNETFGTGYYGGGNGYSVDYHQAYDGTNRDGNANLSPAHYGQQVVLYSQAMKAIDPTIKIGAVLSTPPDDYSWDGKNGQHWNDQVLSQPGISSSVGFVMVHWYPWAGQSYTSYTDTNHNNQFDYTDSNGNGRFDAGESSEPVTAVNKGDLLLNSPRQKIDTMINGGGNHLGANKGLRDYAAQYGIPNAEIMVTEFGYSGNLWTGAAQDPTNYADQAEPLYVADSYTSWLERGVTSVDFLELLQGFLTGSSLTRESAFYGVSMVDRLAAPGDKYVAASSTNTNVSAHAALQADGSVAVMLLNLSPTDSANVTVNVAGAQLGSQGTEYLLINGTSVSQSTASGLGNVFSVTVPARAIVTYIVPALTGDFNGDGRVDAADYVVWRRNGGSSQEFAVWRQNFGKLIGGAGAGSQVGGLGVPEPATVLMAIVAVAGLPIVRSRLNHTYPICPNWRQCSSPRNARLCTWPRTTLRRRRPVRLCHHWL